jgi:hypothetical protein
LFIMTSTPGVVIATGFLQNQFKQVEAWSFS